MLPKIEIVDNVAIPKLRGRFQMDLVEAFLKKTFLKMKVGKSSFIWTAHHNYLYRVAKRFSYQITTRKENGVGVRVWRVK